MSDNNTPAAGLDELERLAKAATPGDLDTVPNPPSEYGGHSTDSYECPACAGQGEVEGETYCNFDGFALGVQFFGIGNEHKNYEAFFRAANPAAVLSLIQQARDAHHWRDRALAAEGRSLLGIIEIVAPLVRAIYPDGHPVIARIDAALTPEPDHGARTEQKGEG